jgi:hypothetical protein
MDLAQAFEIRGVNPGKGRPVVCHSLQEGIEAAASMSTMAAVYFCLNPLAKDAKSASKKTVTGRRWLLVDVDPVRPKGESATDDEKQAAYEVAVTIMMHLQSCGWPDPVVDDSGNGYHLLYRIDLPNDPLSQQIVKRILATLGDRFDTPLAKVDRATHDAPRIAKLPGTWARKGVDSPERPHRMATTVLVPPTLEVVTVEQLEALSPSPGPGTNGEASPSPWGGIPVTEPGGNLEAYVRRAIEGECGKITLSNERNNALNAAAFSLGQLSTWPELDEQKAKEALHRAACAAGLDKDPGCGLSGIDQTIESGWEAGKLQPRARPAQQATTQQGQQGQTGPNWAFWRPSSSATSAPGTSPAPPAQKPATPFSLDMISSTQLFGPVVQPQWQISGVLMANQPTIFGGPMKTLKTSLLIDTLISLGTATPFLGRFTVPKPIRVGMISGEAGRYVIRANALEIARVRGVNIDNEPNISWGFHLPQLTEDEHLKAIERFIRDNGLQAFIFDPFYFMLGSAKIDAKNMFSLGPVLAAFGTLCLSLGCTPILAHHFTKSREDLYAPPELHELAYGGVSQWMTQWCLVARRERFDKASGLHKLHWVHGGSFGHCGELSLDIETGIIQDDFSGRKWNVIINGAAQKIDLAKQKKLDKEAAEESAKLADMAVALGEFKSQPDHKLTKTQLRERMAWSSIRTGHILTRLEKAQEIRPAQVEVPSGRGTRPCPGFELVI